MCGDIDRQLRVTVAKNGGFVSSNVMQKPGISVGKRLLISAFGLLAVYLAWAAALGLLWIEPAKGRLQFAVLRAVPMAIELAMPKTEASFVFCRNELGKSECSPLSPTALERYSNDDRYLFNRPLKNTIAQGIRPSFVLGNMLCRPRSNSIGVTCLYAYDGTGPNGEEFFFCDRVRERCFFPELAGVRYPYG